MAREIKLTIDGTEYDLTRIGTDKRFQNLPAVILGGEVFQGMAIPKQPSIGYEILEVIDNNRNSRICVGSGTLFNYVESDTIIKVRRLSDKVEFCVGDKCYYEIGGNKTHFNIGKFVPTENELQVYDSFVPKCSLEKTRKVEQPVPLFTTEDGADMFLGQDLWIVDVNSSWLIEKVKCNSHDGKNKTYHYFSTKEAAENYVIENKNSINYIDLYQNSSWYDGGGINERRVFNVASIKMLIKSKIK